MPFYSGSSHTFPIRYMKAKGIKFTKKSPFFIDAKGQAFFRPHGTRLDWSVFAALRAWRSCQWGRSCQ